MITPVFVHAGVVHFAVNVLLVLWLGSLFEISSGFVPTLFVMVISGAFGNIVGGCVGVATALRPAPCAHHRRHAHRLIMPEYIGTSPSGAHARAPARRSARRPNAPWRSAMVTGLVGAGTADLIANWGYIIEGTPAPPCVTRPQILLLTAPRCATMGRTPPLRRAAVGGPRGRARAGHRAGGASRWRRVDRVSV